MEQMTLRDANRSRGRGRAEGTLDKFRAALVGLAVGDALGWPYESGRRRPNPNPDFIEWEKMVGGRFWGYRDTVRRGEYSDDTQLTLAVARCLQADGRLEVERFAYEELPLWLQYERGGGKSVKAAARSLLRPKVAWHSNYYRSPDYRAAGANGAAMRTVPIGLVSTSDVGHLTEDTFKHSISTHGHPRAIVGALLMSLAVRRTLMGHLTELPQLLPGDLNEARASLREADVYHDWVATWDGQRPQAFERELDATIGESRAMLTSAERAQESEPFLREVGALAPETRGSGTATVVAAIFFASRSKKPLKDRVAEAATTVGSDTDTIAAMVGALLGAHGGMAALPEPLVEGIQDRDYLLKVADDLWEKASGQPSSRRISRRRFDKRDALSQLWAWEIGLHEMFWDALSDGDVVDHPTLGRGRIETKRVAPIGRAGYVAKLVRVAFDMGQTCTFHSRVELKSGRLGESLIRDMAPLATEPTQP